jgi:UDP-N-acetylglucosamine--N-acetylmuramyl-(pentapeptide) pyrophosphoryl-undecaprenol N-acetylglucosamine transferase
VRRGAEELLGPGVEFRGVDLPLEPAGGGAPSTFALLGRTGPATRVARRALRAARTQVVCGLGGFTSLPVVLAARSLGLPVALLEINAATGRATRWLAPLAHRVLHAWPATLPVAGAGLGKADKHRCVGPPLGPEHAAPPYGARERSDARHELGFDRDRPLVVVLGGSQGARFLNRFIARNAAELVARGIAVLHQVGPGRLDEAGPGLPHYRATEFVDRVDHVLRAASLVLCRGGASTLAEVAAAAAPAIVVPYPHHKDAHQRANARALGDGVVVVEEHEGTEALFDRLIAFASDRAELERRGALLSAAVPRDGARRLFEELSLLSPAHVSHDRAHMVSGSQASPRARPPHE